MFSRDDHDPPIDRIIDTASREEYEREIAELEAAGIPYRGSGDWEAVQNRRGDGHPEEQQWRIVVYQQSGDQRPPEQEMALAIDQYERGGWELVWRRDDPHRARVRILRPEYLRSPYTSMPEEMVTTPTGSRYACRDITIGEDGRATWTNVDCDSD